VFITTKYVGLLRSRFPSRYVLVIADQAILSGVSFATSVAVARLCAPAQFGLYVLGVAALLVLRELQSSLVTGPMAVLGSMEDDARFARYASPLILLQTLVCAGAAVIAVGASFIVKAASPASPLPQVLAVLAVTLTFVQAQEFCRRMLLVRFRLIRFLINDGVFCVSQLAALGFAVWLKRQGGHTQLLASDVFLCQAGAGAVALLAGAFQVQRFIAPRGLFRAEPLRMNWRFGRWNLLSSVCALAYQQTVYFVLAALAGSAAVAQLEAPRLIVAPFMVLIMGWSNIVGPFAARKFTIEGLAPTKAYLDKITRTFVVMVTIAIVPIAVFSGRIVPLFLGRAYASTGAVLWVWSATVIMMAASCGYGAIFYAGRRPEQGTLSRAAAASLGLPIVCLLTFLWKVEGAALARLASEATLCLTAVWFGRRLRSTNTSHWETMEPELELAQRAV
jgi:O-antigen/teichoic acid export membrane protein